MVSFKQEIRFAQTQDGVRIAYAVSGKGHPLVLATHWLTNVELDWQTPVLGPLLVELSSRFQLVRYNPRGYPPSEGAGMALSLDTFLADLSAVIEATGHERVALYGASGGGPVAVAYAARFPGRVSHLVLVSTFARGFFRRQSAPEEQERFRATLKLIEFGWGVENPAFRQVMTSQLFPGATPEQSASMDGLQRMSTSGTEAAKVLAAVNDFDVSKLLGRIQAPTLVMHSRGEVRVPIAFGRELAAGIDNARFVPLETRNHVPLEGEPAFEQLVDQITSFVPAKPKDQTRLLTTSPLTAREEQILELIARGLDNAQTAAHLDLSEKTVRNHITRIFDKLAVENRSQAIVRAREAGFGL